MYSCICKQHALIRASSPSLTLPPARCVKCAAASLYAIGLQMACSIACVHACNATASWHPLPPASSGPPRLLLVSWTVRQPQKVLPEGCMERRRLGGGGCCAGRIGKGCDWGGGGAGRSWQAGLSPPPSPSAYPACLRRSAFLCIAPVPIACGVPGAAAVAAVAAVLCTAQATCRSCCAASGTSSRCGSCRQARR